MVVWSWLTFPSICLITQLACSNHVGCFIAVTVVTFRNSSRGPVDSSNLFVPPRETAAKFSDVHLPLKQRVSRTLLHSALSRSIKWALCVANDWVAHELCSCWSWPSLVSATPTVACTLRRHFISSLARSCRLARREASCVCDGTLYSVWRKESSRTKAGSAPTEGSFGQWPCRRSMTASGSTTHALIGRFWSPAAWLVVIKDKLRLIARYLAILV